MFLRRHPQKSLNPKISIFENRNFKTFRILRGLEQHSSSSGWRVMTRYVPGTIVDFGAIKGTFSLF